MFRRPAVYHPYKPSVPLSPAGFRLRDFIPKRRCFNLFQGPDPTNTRSPDPSPLSSPVRGARYPDDDAPPTICLADLFGDGFASPQRPSNPTADRHQDAQPNAVPAKDPLPIPPRRKCRHGPKHLSLKKDAHRRSQQLKDRRDAFRKQRVDGHERRMVEARDAFTRLRKEAEALMTPEHMIDEDRIFLEQLGNLDLDQKLKHDLERCRQQMARAAEETEERRKAHEARDAEAAKLWGEKQDEEAREEQKRKVEEFVRRNDSGREARLRRAEEDAMRADEKRQRANQAAERKVREEQERLFREELARKAKEIERRRRSEQERRSREERERQEREERERRLREQERRLREEVERARRAQRERLEREEQERKLREEIERLSREAHERFLREERERLAREERERQARSRAEQARRAAEEDRVRQHFALYEAKWNELRTSNSLPPIDIREMPWPVLGVISSADQITHQDVQTFLFHPLRPGAEGKTARDKVKSEVLRFHPDKFNTRIVPKIQSSQQAVAQEIAGAVARILTTIMTEEVEQQK